MARFVMSNKLANRKDEGRRRSQDALRTFFQAELRTGTKVVSEPPPPAEVARQVMIFDADPAEIDVKRKTLPSSVILEPEKLRQPMSTRRSPLLTGFREALLATAKVAAPGTGATLGVTVRGDGGGPVEGAEVILFLRAGIGDTLRMPALDAPPLLTDGKGEFAFHFAKKWTPVALVVDPPGDYWGVIRRGLVGTGVTVTLPALPPAAGHIEWWHESAKTAPFVAHAGKGIKVGVVDTGAGRHPALNHVTVVGAFLDGNVHLSAADGTDARSHGSHVCGIIGGRPAKATQYGGIAPGADLYAARVFDANGGASQADIANAVDHLAGTVGVHLINLSLGGDSSQIEQDAIRRARDIGTLCVCAAGNDGGRVSFPAAYPETVAVAALGKNGWGPPGTIAASAAPTDPLRYGAEGLYLADFSNFGPNIAVAAPGVGIISTVPERHGLTAPYAAMNGTSMASPVACGRLAVLLAADAKYLAAPPDDVRVDRARVILTKNCRDIHLDGDYQGNGAVGK